MDYLPIDKYDKLPYSVIKCKLVFKSTCKHHDGMIIKIEILVSQISNFYRISTNPFGSDSENDEPDDTTDTDSLSAKRTPVPTPRKQM